ncbi:hypothetical protein [Halospeciosus flavus]|uniref:DUF106 domain-containing protein n=1 Tax=Halospeciosus flavus TaxID=3032283 RepID=A0ABD5YZ16_9EURY
MPAGFYAALATSASVFIGILTALLVSNLSNLKAERHWINRRLEEIDAKLRGLDREQTEIEDKTHNINEPRYVEKPRFSPEREFYRESEGSQAANVQADIQSARQHNRNHRRWLQLRSRREALTDERQQLVSRYEALDPANITATLKASVVAILFSVVVPSIAYLFRVLEVATELGPVWIRPTAVFAAWLGGLGYVFIHLYREITAQSDESLTPALEKETQDTSDENQPV